MWLFSELQKDFGVWIEKWDCRYAENWCAQSTGVRQFGKLERSDEGEKEKEYEMEQSKEKTLLGRVLGERLEQVCRHDSALAFEITVEVYLEIKI